MAETPEEKDPIVSDSMAGIFLISVLALMVVFTWSLYNEFFGLRPWKSYQEAFIERYGAYLRKQIPQQEAAEKAILSSPEYTKLNTELTSLQATVKPQLADVQKQIAYTQDELQAVMDVSTDARARATAEVWSIEHTSGSEKRSLKADLASFEKGPFVVRMPTPDGKINPMPLDYDALQAKFVQLTAQKSDYMKKQADILQPVSALQAKRNSYVTDHLTGLTPVQLQGLLTKVDTFDIDIKQINLPDMGVVDRCESCHAGIREPVDLTKANMGGDQMAGAFTTHPDPALLSIHDPDKFGCTPCHNGSGMELDSVAKAHGDHEHWLWPLYPKANVEAGCQQCHVQDMVLDHGPVISEGKELLEWRGCIGCHHYQGYDPEPDEIANTGRDLNQLAKQRAEDQLDVTKAIQAGDNAPDNATARKDYAEADDLRLSISKVDMETDQLNQRVKHLQMDMKKVGPDLKEVKAKLDPAWIPVWLTNPHAFRPTTRMPRFRLDQQEVHAIAAFIWQDALDARAPKQPAGDPVKGKESFDTRGCMACHAIGEGSNAVGGWFAANLSRVGEKENYDYLVRWIHNPRERSAPYCPYEKRDLTPADYAKHGLPYVFDLAHSKCPNDGHQLIVEQMTPMPSLRLSWQESRDIASYLMTLKDKDPSSYPPAPYLNDPKLKAEGRALVQRYGCAGCHEIAGLENEGKIGTDLTTEGSKPIEQMDFALFVREAKDEDWYSPKGFFQHKLSEPELYDKGMVKAESEKLKMPDFFDPVSSKVTEGLPDLAPEAKEQVNALTTLLMGSVTSEYPERYFYLPEGQKKDIQEGWWIVKKYNCMGCHQFTLDQSSILETLPQYQTPDGKGQLPPRLVTEGARVNPEWLARFLDNPSLSTTDTDRDGVRSYLKLRMPTFYFSPIEIRTLVRFFQALSQQPMPYIAPKLEPLTTQEVAMARALFTSRGAPCLKCHAIGLPAHDQYATAPNFLLASGRLKPDWVSHWLLDPSMIDPGTAMPSGLFKLEADHYVFAGPEPPIFQGYTGDQANLLMRYLFELTPEEQQRLIQMSGGSLNPVPAKAASTQFHNRTRHAVPVAMVGMLTKSHSARLP